MNYQTFSQKESSAKVILVDLEASQRVVGFSVHSGTVYKRTDFDFSVISKITDSGVELVEVSSIEEVGPGKYFNDRSNKVLYLEASDSANPNGKFLGMTFRMFFSNYPAQLPFDLGSGKDVNWIPLVENTSEFSLELDNKQFGQAVESRGSVNFINDQSFWGPIFDKYTFENKRCSVYSWSPDLPVTEAKIIYRGRVKGKDWNTRTVSFKLSDVIEQLKTPLDLEEAGNISGALLPQSLRSAKQRRIYGYLRGARFFALDQVVEGFELDGTISVTQGSATITGSGTSFLSDLKPEDQITLEGIDDAITIASIQSDTQLTASNEFELASQSLLTYKVRPNRPKPYTNREFLIAGHALKEVSTTVTKTNSLRRFEVDDASDLLPGDEIKVGSEIVSILRISGSAITLAENLLFSPTVGTTVTRQAVTNVYINDDELVLDRDYTVDAANARVNLELDAELNIAKTVKITGSSVSFTSSSRTVTGVGTSFTSDLSPGDWIRPLTETVFFEVLQINSDTELELTGASSYTTTGAPFAKRPKYFNEKEDIFSADVFGKTENGLKTGVFIKTASQIVKDLIVNDTGVPLSEINTETFDETAERRSQRLGVSIPDKFNGRGTRKIRDIISDVNTSIFGALYQNEDLLLEYKAEGPRRSVSSTSLKERDVISFSIQSDSTDIVKKAIVNYDFREIDPVNGLEANSTISKTSNEGEFLSETPNELTKNTLLIDANDARIFASRWAFIRRKAINRLSIESKLQIMRLSIADLVNFEHEKLFDRVGTQQKTRSGAIMSTKKTPFGVSIEIDDFNSCYSSVAIITENDSNNFTSATDIEKIVFGFITDTYGMQDNNPDTYGINLIY